MAVLLGEEGAQTVREVVQHHTGDVVVPFVAMMETEYKLLRQGRDHADRGLAAVFSWPVSILESDAAWRGEATRIKSRGRLSFADSWVAALALLRDAELVHKDPEFDSFDEVRVLKLPYKQRTRRS